MNKNKVKIAITVIALGIIVARFIWPNIQVDAITLGLIIVAILPWLTSIIESAKFPGGWEVKFRDVKAATDKILGDEKSGTKDQQADYFSRIAEYDSNLALVALRIEVEKRVRELADASKINTNQPLSRVIRELQKSDEEHSQFYTGLLDLIAAGNQAAHGAKVESTVSEWASIAGPKVIESMDKIILVKTLPNLLNLRDGPGIQHPILATITKGAELRVLQKSGDWIEIQTKDNVRGWVYSKYTQDAENSKGDKKERRKERT